MIWGRYILCCVFAGDQLWGEIWDIVQLTDGYDHLCLFSAYLLWLVVLLDLHIFVFGGVSFVNMCGLAVDWVRLCFSGSMFACAYVCRFSVLMWFCFLCFCVYFMVVVTSRLPMGILWDLGVEVGSHILFCCVFFNEIFSIFQFL